jgi:NADH-quinone oxidoreductase subunit J
VSVTTALVYAAGFVAGMGALGVVLSQHALYSALSLVVNMVSLAVLFLLLNAQFLAAVQVIIYAGAVMVLFVFIIALLNPGSGTETERRIWRERSYFGIGVLAVIGMTVLIAALALNGTTYDKSTGQLHGQKYALLAQPDDTVSFQYDIDSVNQNGNVQTVGGALFTRFLLPFEITSALLLVAAIGAVYLTRRPPHDRTTTL